MPLPKSKPIDYRKITVSGGMSPNDHSGQNVKIKSEDGKTLIVENLEIILGVGERNIARITELVEVEFVENKKEKD